MDTKERAALVRRIRAEMKADYNTPRRTAYFRGLMEDAASEAADGIGDGNPSPVILEDHRMDRTINRERNRRSMRRRNTFRRTLSHGLNAARAERAHESRNPPGRNR